MYEKRIWQKNRPHKINIVDDDGWLSNLLLQLNRYSGLEHVNGIEYLLFFAIDWQESCKARIYHGSSPHDEMSSYQDTLFRPSVVKSLYSTCNIKRYYLSDQSAVIGQSPVSHVRVELTSSIRQIYSQIIKNWKRRTKFKYY